MILYLSIGVKLTPGYSDLKLKEVGAADIEMGMIHMKMMFKTMELKKKKKKTMELDEISPHPLYK